MKTYTDEQLLTKVESLATFKGWKKGVTDILVRSKKDEFNKFDDKAYTFECIKDGERPKFIMVMPITTNAGSQGLYHYEKFNSLGCAVACADVIVYNSHIYGPHGKTKYMAYIQSFSVGFPYTRDNDKDKQAENYGKVYTNRIGMNCHKAGKRTVDINGNSVACFVRPNEDEYNKWLAFMNKRPLTIALLHEF